MVHQWKLAEGMHFTTLTQVNAISKQCPKIPLLHFESS